MLPSPTTGPTSETKPEPILPTRITGELIERYEALSRVEHDNGFPDDWYALRERLWAGARIYAQEWADRHGVEIVAYAVDRSYYREQPEVNAAGAVSPTRPVLDYSDVGIAWDVQVGHMDTDPASSELGKTWVWSARWMHWWGRFAQMDTAVQAQAARAYVDEFERTGQHFGPRKGFGHDSVQLDENTRADENAVAEWVREQENMTRPVFVVPNSGPLSAYGVGKSPFDDDEPDLSHRDEHSG